MGESYLIGDEGTAMRKQTILLLSAFFFTGCATIDNWQPGGRHSGPTTLAPALGKLSAGDSPGAAKVLKKVCESRAVSGVTDEALFRLALLSLKPTPDIPVSRRGRQLLQRLKKEYPASPWTRQAAPLIDLIKVVDELTHHNQDLEADNESLTRQISVLNDHIKQLKYLEVELEKTR
jgi:hypothetical protein